MGESEASRDLENAGHDSPTVVTKQPVSALRLHVSFLDLYLPTNLHFIFRIFEFTQSCVKAQVSGEYIEGVAPGLRGGIPSYRQCASNVADQLGPQAFEDTFY